MAIKVTNLEDEYRYLDAHPHKCSILKRGRLVKVKVDLAIGEQNQLVDRMTAKCENCGTQILLEFDITETIPVEAREVALKDLRRLHEAGSLPAKPTSAGEFSHREGRIDQIALPSGAKPLPTSSKPGKAQEKKIAPQPTPPAERGRVAGSGGEAQGGESIVAALMVLSESGEPETTFRLPGDSTLFIGRAVAGRNGLRIDRPDVALIHCRIETDGKYYTVINECTLGISVNDAKTPRARLEEGDIISVGATRIRFIRQAPPVEPAAANRLGGQTPPHLIGLLTEIGDERAVEPLLQHFGSGEKPREVERFFARINAQKPATEQQPGATAPASPEAAPVATVVRQEPQARAEPAPTQAQPAEGNQPKATSRDPGQTIPATSPGGAAATVPKAEPTPVSGKVKRAVLRPKGEAQQASAAVATVLAGAKDEARVESSPVPKADKLHMMSEALRAFMGGGGNADQAFESLFADLKDKDPEIRAEASRLLAESTDAQLRLVTIYQECLKSDPRRASLAGRVLGRHIAAGQQGMIDADIGQMTFGLKVSFLPCGCDHCGKLNKGIPAPPNGGMVPYYSQKDNKGAYAVPVLCDKCGMEFFVVWDQNPR